LADFFSSHVELRGAVEFARKRIRDLTGDSDPALPVLDKALAEARITAQAYAEHVITDAGNALGEEYGLDED
jgi:hypothetical protein